MSDERLARIAERRDDLEADSAKAAMWRTAEISYLLAELRIRDDAIDAVRKIVDDKYRIWAAVCGNTCSKDLMGVDHDAIADEINAVVHEAINAALDPQP